ncbi:PPC domain-containing DNA-binding protein [Vibrio sonorensis]|uniref:PPC domain-containing DNA-binding protein n=1 Tax=Vibrio sonorensis TaxID=1004316 RepID=UPI0008DB29F3|nr:PPC domain-containing DNA-binding protein [Vibrio sonorensis]
MITPIAIRLHRGSDLKQSIKKLVDDNRVKAGTILSCVGSLSSINLRLAGASQTLFLHSSFEIVSVVGTLTPDHQHIHISVADGEGKVIGGHLLDGAVIDTTAELIIAKLDQLHFSREIDSQTGFTELKLL